MQDEICLEGLDGITLQALWLRLANRLVIVANIFYFSKYFYRPQYSLGLSPEAKLFVWDCILQMDEVTFYQLEQPRGDLELYDRCYYKNIWRQSENI